MGQSYSVFFSFCPFFGIVLYRVHKKFEVVYPIYGLWLTVFWTFSKDFTKVLSVYDVKIPVMAWPAGLYFNGNFWQLTH